MYQKINSTRYVYSNFNFFILLASFLLCGWFQATAHEEGPVRIQFNGYGMACIDFEDIEKHLPHSAVPCNRIALMHRAEPVPVLIIGGEDGSFDSGDSILFFSKLSISRYTNTNVYALHTDSEAGLFLDPPGAPPASVVTSIMDQADRMYTHMYSHLFARSRQVRVKMPCDYSPFKKLDIEIVPKPGCDPSATLVVSTPKRTREVHPQSNGIVRFEYSMEADGVLGKNIWIKTELPDNIESYTLYLKESRDRDNRMAIYLDMQQDQGIVYFPGFEPADYYAWHVEGDRLLWTQSLEQESVPLLGLCLDKGKCQVFISTRKNALKPARIFRQEPIEPPLIEAKYLAITPEKFAGHLKDHMNFRKQEFDSVATVTLESIYSHYSHFEPDPEAIRSFILEKAQGVKYLLLIGAARERVNAGYGRPYIVPAEYYDTFDLLPPMPYMYRHVFVACDTLYGDMDLDGVPEIAVGRIPCTTGEQLEAVLEKIRCYETEEILDETNRRVFLQAGLGRFDAYGGSEKVGETIEGMVEQIAGRLVSEWIPEACDVKVLYSASSSNYFFTPSRFRDQVISELNEGFYSAFYIGHGSVCSYDDFTWRKEAYQSFLPEDARKVAIEKMRGPYYALTCLSGTFPRRQGLPCMAEELFMNPKGPSAVVGASRSVDEITNFCYTLAVLKAMFHDRCERMGDLLNAVKKNVPEQRDNPQYAVLIGMIRTLLASQQIPEEERIMLGQFQYNLFGDPAMKIRHPQGKIAFQEISKLEPGSEVEISCSVSNLREGRAWLTLELPVDQTREPTVRPTSEMSREEAEALIVKNYGLVNQRRLHESICRVREGAFTCTVKVPADAPRGAVLIKAYASDGKTDAMGAIKARVH